MNDYQKELIRIFSILNQEFKRINLQWFPYAGTLLGVVRHKGIIPWDDDIDMVARHFDLVKNIDNIKKICKENNLEIISYTDYFDKDVIRIYSNNISKVTIEEVDFENRVFIEIHPLKTSDGKENLRLLSLYSNLASVSNMPIGKYKNKFPLKKTKNIMKHIGRSIGTILVPRKLFKKIVVSRLKKPDEGYFYFPIYNFSKSNNFLFDLSSYEEMQFENEIVTLPSNYLDYLKWKFGDNWNKIPDGNLYFPKHIINWTDNRWNKKK